MAGQIDHFPWIPANPCSEPHDTTSDLWHFLQKIELSFCGWILQIFISGSLSNKFCLVWAAVAGIPFAPPFGPFIEDIIFCCIVVRHGVSQLDKYLCGLSTHFCFPSIIFVLNRYSLIVCKYESALAWNFRLHYLFMSVKLWGAEFLSAVFLWWTRKGSIVSTARCCKLKYRSAKLRLNLIFVVCSKSWYIYIYLLVLRIAVSKSFGKLGQNYSLKSESCVFGKVNSFIN